MNNCGTIGYVFICMCVKNMIQFWIYICGLQWPWYQTFQEGRQLKHLSWDQERKERSFKKYLDTMEHSVSIRQQTGLQGYKADHISSGHKAGKDLTPTSE